MRKHDKRVRVQVFSGSTSHYRQFELSWRRFVTLILAVGFGLMILVMGALFLFNSFYQDIGLESFVMNNMKLDRYFEPDIQPVSQKVTLAESGETDYNDLSRYSAASQVSQPSSSESPLIEPDEDIYLSYADNNTSEDTLKIATLIDELEMQLDEAVRVHDEINEKYESKEALKNFPSIIPLQEGEWRISDLFGKRRDPIGKKNRHHNGLDIAASKGTPVYAPAAGIVELAQHKYSLNRGYGRVVKINHGKEIITLYGHLHKIFVKPGQRVNRWDVIGLVGTTGRSTGPHLHYEVYVRDKAIDPMNYILK